MSDLTKHAKGRRMPYEQDIEQIKKNKEAIEELVANKLTAGSGIVIEDNEVSVDEEVVALKDELPAEVEAITPTGTETTLEGLKIGDTIYKVGGGDKLYQHTLFLKTSNMSIFFTLISKKQTFASLQELKSSMPNLNVYPGVVMTSDWTSTDARACLVSYYSSTGNITYNIGNGGNVNPPVTTLNYDYVTEL